MVVRPNTLLAFGIMIAATACGSLQDLKTEGLNQIAAASSTTDANSTSTSLNGTGSETAKEPDVSFLSAAAQATLVNVKAIGDQIHTKVDAICAHDQTLRDTVKAAIDAIVQDSSKTESEKHAAVQAVFEQYKDQAEADRTRMETCLSENADSVKVWKDLGQSVAEACLIQAPQGGQGRGDRGPGQGGSMPPPPPKGEKAEGHGRGGPGGPGGKGPAPLTEAQKQEFETKLTSETCTLAITKAQDALK